MIVGATKFIQEVAFAYDAQGSVFGKFRRIQRALMAGNVPVEGLIILSRVAQYNVEAISYVNQQIKVVMP